MLLEGTVVVLGGVTFYCYTKYLVLRKQMKESLNEIKHLNVKIKNSEDQVNTLHSTVFYLDSELNKSSSKVHILTRNNQDLEYLNVLLNKNVLRLSKKNELSDEMLKQTKLSAVGNLKVYTGGKKQ